MIGSCASLFFWSSGELNLSSSSCTIDMVCGCPTQHGRPRSTHVSRSSAKCMSLHMKTNKLKISPKYAQQRRISCNLKGQRFAQQQRLLRLSKLHRNLQFKKESEFSTQWTSARTKNNNRNQSSNRTASVRHDGGLILRGSPGSRTTESQCKRCGGKRDDKQPGTKVTGPLGSPTRTQVTNSNSNRTASVRHDGGILRGSPGSRTTESQCKRCGGKRDDKQLGTKVTGPLGSPTRHESNNLQTFVELDFEPFDTPRRPRITTDIVTARHCQELYLTGSVNSRSKSCGLCSSHSKWEEA